MTLFFSPFLSMLVVDVQISGVLLFRTVVVGLERKNQRERERERETIRLGEWDHAVLFSYTPYECEAH